MRQFLIAVLLLGITSVARATDVIDIEWSGGLVTIDECESVNDGTTIEWQIAITVSGGATTTTVTIRPQPSANPYAIRWIKVKSVKNGSVSNIAKIDIDESGLGMVSHIRSFQVVDAYPSTNAEVWL